MSLRLIGLSICLAMGWLMTQVPVHAYINSGAFRSTFPEIEKRIKSDGWSASFSSAMPSPTEVAQGVVFDPPENPEFVRFVNQLVAKAIKQLPEDSAQAISIDTKRQLAHAAREAIIAGGTKGCQTFANGKIGSVKYQVGILEVHSYWQWNDRRNGRSQHAAPPTRMRLVPFVALKVEGRNDPAD